MTDYDNAPTDPSHGGKMTQSMMADRIAELEAKITEWKMWCSGIMCDFSGLYQETIGDVIEWHWIDENRPAPTIIMINT